jgi:DNA topoisomerase-3
MILQQPVERAQMQKLLATGRTDLLTQFVSKKGRRFKAYLVKTAEGKVGFEFEARAPRRAARASATATAAAPAAQEPHSPSTPRVSRPRGKPPAGRKARARRTGPPAAKRRSA